MKDIYDKELKKELPEILYAMMEKNKQMYISVTNDGEVIRILNEEILYLTIDGRKTKIVCFNNKETYCVCCREKLKALYMELHKERFGYVHTSYIVNMSKIIHIEQKEITLINGEKLYISRLKSKDFDQAFTKFLNRKFRR